jgi:hypothetical protein
MSSDNRRWVPTTMSTVPSASPSTTLDRLEHRADRNLGLAETDVSEDQPIHRLILLHVGLDVVDGPLLVRRLLVGEVGFELGLPRGVGCESVTARSGALAVQSHDLVGDDGDLSPDTRAGLGPVGATHARQAR